ncbi:MAG: hypothetical protein K0R57_6237 [Paenibacillaceae bacterium]|nr:hypothetical protein [Paenibacillaceae bacterium]
MRLKFSKNGKRQWTRFISALLVCVLLPWYGLAYASDPLPGLPYHEDFESGSAQGWTVDTGTWTVGNDNGTLAYQTLSSQSIARAVYGENNWDHYKVSVDFKMNGWGSTAFQTAGLMMRYTDANNYYLFTFDNPGEIRIRKKVGGVATNLASKAVNLSLGEWYTMEASVDHARLKLYLNGVEELSVIDLALDSGKAGLISSFGSNSYDNVQIEQIDSPVDTQAPTLPVNVQAQENDPGVVSLTWTASTDNDAVAGYKVFRNGTELAFAPANSYNDISTLPSTSYTYTVSAVDLQGNESALSDPAMITTAMIVNNTTFDSDLLGVHPRLLISDDMQAELDRRAADPDYASFYTNLITVSNNAPATVNWFSSSEGSDFNWEYVSWRLPTLAMGYWMTKDPAYGSKIRNYVFDLIARPEWGGEQGGSVSNGLGLMGVGYAYDWGYDLFTPEEKIQIATKLKLQAKKLYTQFSTNLSGSLAFWKSDYQNNHRQFRIEGLLTGTAAIMGDLNDPEIAVMYEFAEQELITLLQERAPDGSQHESAQYMLYGDEHIIRSVAAYESVTSIPLWNETLHNIGEFKQYLYGPGLTRLAPYADDSNTLYYFNHILFKIASVYQDAQLQSMAEKAYQVSPGSFAWQVWSFLFYDDSLEPDPTPLPGWKYFEDLEYVNMRSGWEADDLSVAFKSGPPGGNKLNEWRDRITPDGTYVNIAHDRPEAGNFYIEFGGKRWGDFPPYDKVDRLTKDHNTILVDGKGQHGERTDAWFQPFVGMRDEAQVSEFFGSPGYGLTTGDIRNAYDNMSRMDRDVLFIDDRYVIVHDTLESATVPREFEFLFHNNGVWTGTLEDGYVITQDAASMELHMLQPDSMQATLAPARKAAMGTTLKVSPSTAQKDTSFLGVFFPRRNGETLPAKPTMIQDDEGTKLTVSRDGGVTDTIAFRDSAAAAGSLTIPRAVASAQTLVLTTELSQVKDAMISRGTSLSLADIRFDFAEAVNARYSKEADGFTLWTAPPLKSGLQSAEATIRGLVPLAAYELEWSTGAQQTLTADSSGVLAVVLDLTAENLSVRVEGPTASDTVLPTAPTGLSAVPVSDTKIILDWTASTDNIGVSGYEILRDSQPLGQTTATHFTDTGLSASTAYTYEVRASDLAGNISGAASVTTTTLSPDITPPSTPAGLTGYQSASGIELNWTASTDDRAMAGYQVYKDGTLVGFTDTPAFKDQDTSPNTTYVYTVEAVDESGNISGLSSPFSLTTSNVMYSTDFEQPVPEWSVPTGTWSLATESGNQVYKPSTGYDNSAVVGSDDWTDYRAQVKVKLNAFTNTGSPHVGLRIRQTDNNNYYLLAYNNGNLSISRKVNGHGGGLISKSFVMTPGEWYTLEAEVKGNTLKLYVNGNLELTRTDNSLTNGRSGLSSRYADVRFDDFMVYQEPGSNP